MKKVWILTLVVCILLVGIIGLVMLLPGFQRRNDVFVSDFSLLEDGKALTVQIGVAGWNRLARRTMFCCWMRIPRSAA